MLLDCISAHLEQPLSQSDYTVGLYVTDITFTNKLFCKSSQKYFKYGRLEGCFPAYVNVFSRSCNVNVLNVIDKQIGV